MGWKTLILCGLPRICRLLNRSHFGMRKSFREIILEYPSCKGSVVECHSIFVQYKTSTRLISEPESRGQLLITECTVQLVIGHTSKHD